MTEGILKSYDPLRYHVNNVSEFDSDVVIAHKQRDNKKISELLTGDKLDYDVFICVNKAWHAFVMCVVRPAKPDDNPFASFPQESMDPFDVPGLLFVYQFELCFENEALKTYKINKRFTMFTDVKDRIKKSYHIGTYCGITNVRAFQFAALRSAPHRYSVMLGDCVEFAKEFCDCLLAYCDNYKNIEKGVHENIQKAAASGLSMEALSRRVKSSAGFMNTFLGSIEMSTFLGGVGSGRLFIGALFLLLYTLVVTVIVSYLTAYFMR